jgi:para-aminobenzoate synthetase component 1
LTFEVCSDLDPEQELNNILNYTPKPVEKKINNLAPRVSKKKYLQNVKAIQDHIKKGDVYELNYCIDYYSENSIIDPCDVYNRLNSITESPMSTLFKFEEINIISSSPERYISKRNNKVFSQPIKGTARRNPNELIDKEIRSLLTKNIKEKAENHMIVDLVRNDLSRISEKGKVRVTELSKLYSFKNVHQLISTVECEIDKNTLVSQIIESTFPMGSMTGAPKIKSMKLIDKFENVSRGIYSGSVGYFMPNGDFDFNVVIRSIIYDSNNEKLNLNIGSAITYNSKAENEYDECQLKAEAMIEALK